MRYDMSKLRVGQWVRIRPRCDWVGEPKGRVTQVFDRDLYFVEFQRPAQDTDGDGPYLAACLPGSDLRKTTYLG
jgi:hypothetical protein